MPKRLRTSLIPALSLATELSLVACSGTEENSSSATTSSTAPETPRSSETSSSAAPTPPPLNAGPAPALTGTFEMDGPATITGAT